ncbi:aminotransferase class IV family protein [Amycolatopsis viridis]|uniref:Branched-subunit amino acid aminotransferase/4-amino-4-deoxychorismate lyase n=1 Tax=Amycolatopsis viridis TaxID=185678 RepID=A0ABX0STW9_9PSEU|nr:aminotransferase class IV family protein [Amycolatopsis viridis]NIH78815.1 branched-subunit amino acid aminotransferase/4-amino-4-deoxychorismate lyase [Amycolatopsis viridis]
MNVFVAQRNGRAATAEDLAPLAFAGYAHFTAMQVRDGRVRGLDLHLARLRTASAELFDRTPSDELVRTALRSAIAAGPRDLSLTATVFEPSGEFTGSGREPEVLVRTGPAAVPPAGPLSLAAVEHERALPAVKHVGEVAKTYHLRQARKRGFDDAAFVDRRGRLSEATIWNLAFWDGSTVVWPVADMLGGVTMGIVRRQLDRLGVPQRAQEITTADLPALRGAVVMNSWTPGVPVHRIGGVELPTPPSFVETLHRAYEAEPLVAP